MTRRNDFISILIIVLTLLLLPVVPVGGEVEHEGVFRLTGNGQLSLTDVESGESLSVVYRDSKNRYNQRAINAINHLLRCHGDNTEYPISLKLIEFVDYIQDSFGAAEVKVASGYRSPGYNKKLARKLRRAVTDSLHTQGMAVDIMLPNVGKVKLSRFAAAQEFGGIGTYRRSHFTHIDSGPVRKW